jgi:hypothetical protein
VFLAKNKNNPLLLYLKVMGGIDNIIYTCLRPLVQIALWYLYYTGSVVQQGESENIPKWMLLQTSTVSQFVILKEPVVAKIQDTQKRETPFGM